MTLSHNYLATFFSSAPFVEKIHCHDNTLAKFWISKMSVPEPPYNISCPEDIFKPSLRRVTFFAQTSPSQLTSCACTSPSHRRDAKLCSILWLPIFNISIFKFNLSQFLYLISLFPSLLPIRFCLI